MNWFILALTAAFFVSISRTITRLLMRNGGNDKAFTAIHNGFAALIALAFVPFFPLIIPPLSWSWVLLAGALVFYTLADLFVVRALATVESSTNALIMRFITVWVTIGGITLYHEAATMPKLIGVVLIVAGSCVLLIRGNVRKMPPGILYSIASTLFLATAFLMDKTLVTKFSIPLYTAITFITPSLLLIPNLKHPVAELSKELRTKGVLLPVAGTIFGLYMLCQLFAYQIGEASRVTPVIDASILLTVLLGIVFLKERSSIIQKIIGAVLILIGLTVIR